MGPRWRHGWRQPATATPGGKSLGWSGERARGAEAARVCEGASSRRGQGAASQTIWSPETPAATTDAEEDDEHGVGHSGDDAASRQAALGEEGGAKTAEVPMGTDLCEEARNGGVARRRTAANSSPCGREKGGELRWRSCKNAAIVCWNCNAVPGSGKMWTAEQCAGLWGTCLRNDQGTEAGRWVHIGTVHLLQYVL